MPLLPTPRLDLQKHGRILVEDRMQKIDFSAVEQKRGARCRVSVMGNSLRCCIACMIPCGNLDVVRVLHADGRVDEYSRSITAGEVMKANPKHVVSQPICEGLVKKPSLLHPEAELHKGKIYFLIPTYSLHRKSKSKLKNSEVRSSTKGLTEVSAELGALPQQKVDPLTRLERSCHRRRRVMVQRGKVWKPMLENIPEEDDPSS